MNTVTVRALVDNAKTRISVNVESGQSALMALEDEAVNILNKLNAKTCLFSYNGNGFRVSKTGKKHFNHDGFSFDRFSINQAAKQGTVLA